MNSSSRHISNRKIAFIAVVDYKAYSFPSACFERQLEGSFKLVGKAQQSAL